MKTACLCVSLLVTVAGESLRKAGSVPARKLTNPNEACNGKAEGAACTFDMREGGTKSDTCQSGKCGTGTGPPGGGGEVTGPMGGGGEGGYPQTGAAAKCTSPPCAAGLLGDVALTTVSGTDTLSGVTFSPGENIYGPFEAGFSSQQDGILEGLGCSGDYYGKGHVVGGIDTHAAEQMVAHQCGGITLPRMEGGTYISLLDQCGGHTKEYHFHERLSCLYKEEGGHSTKVGETPDGTPIYGKWEDYASRTLPVLDACGGSFGVTPDSAGKSTYHYHVQDSPPFTIGCYGPAKNAQTGVEEPVSLKTCRELYDGCGNGDEVTITTKAGSVKYDLWCPCFDSKGSNVPGANADLGTLQTITEVQQNNEAGTAGIGNSGIASSVSVAPALLLWMCAAALYLQ